VSLTVEIRGLRVMGVHGALAEERLRAQPFEVDLDVELDADAAVATDDLADTADYGRFVRVATEVVSGRPRNLLESLAGAIAEALLEVDKVTGVTVTVRKLRPPVASDVRSAGVRVTRQRP
jgi:dihydroneopterin aldolase